jgi:hypothetical protein
MILKSLETGAARVKVYGIVTYNLLGLKIQVTELYSYLLFH